MMAFKNEKSWVFGSILLFFVVGFWYSIVVPPFETPDELYHYAFVHHLAEDNWLPVQRAEEPGPWLQEGSQAPLYYILAGWLTRWVDQHDYAAFTTVNPRANIGDPLFSGNKNHMLYSARKTCIVRCDNALSLPLRATNLAIHIARWFSLLLSGLSLWFIYKTGKLAFPATPAIPIFAILFVASIPQFTFISASVSNDSMIIAASCITIYWLASLLHKNNAHSVTLFDWSVLGVLLGVAALSKLQGLGLWLVAFLVGATLSWQQRNPRLLLRAALPVGVPVLIICGWWYWRNYSLYGDWLGLSYFVELNGQRDGLPSWQVFWGELRGMRYSFWGLFGWFNLLLPRAVYRFLDAATLVSLVGLIAFWIQPFAPKIFGQSSRSTQGAVGKAESAVHTLLVGWALLSLAQLLYWSSRTEGSQGRLLFPGMVAFALLFSAGWISSVHLCQRVFSKLSFYRPKPFAAVGQNHSRSRLYQPVLLAPPLLLLASSLYALVWLLPQAYIPAPPVVDIPAQATTAEFTYVDPEFSSEQLQLHAIHIPDERYQLGDSVPVTLYHSTDSPISNDYQLFIQLLNEDGTEIANLTSHPGWGRNPTSLWEPKKIYPDRYQVKITEPIAPSSPLLARVYTGFIKLSAAEEERFPVSAYNAKNQKVAPFVTSAIVTPFEPDEVDIDKINAIHSNFGNVIELVGYIQPAQIDFDTESMDLQLYWQALASPGTDYVSFVHLRATTGEQIAGFDQPPAANRFPTKLWRKGDRITSSIRIALPDNLTAGTYELWAGLYEDGSQGAIRVPITDGNGHKVEHNQILLGAISVAASR